MYKTRKKQSKKLERMRKARERKRLESDPPDYPINLPELRREIIIIDYDFGRVVEKIQLYKSNRIDCYKAIVNGQIWKNKIGWAKVLESIRKSFIRVRAV